jgi:N-acetylmuramic acid 6-phosphate (MurNAc-6-P) etherase
LRDRLAEFAQSEPKDYTGKVEISKFEVVEEKIVVGLAVEYKTNFQEAAVRAARKNKFMAMLKQHVSDLGIEQ